MVIYVHKGIWKLNGWLFLHFLQNLKTDFRHQVLHVVHFITVYLLAMYLSLFRGTFMSLSLFCCLNLNHTKYTSFKSERPRSEVNIMNGGRRWLKLLSIQVAFYSKISCFTPVYSVISLWFDQIFHILWHITYDQPHLKMFWLTKLFKKLLQMSLR